MADSSGGAGSSGVVGPGSMTGGSSRYDELTLLEAQHAGKIVDQQLYRDERAPELWDVLSSSGVGEYTLDHAPQFYRKSLVVLPEALLEQYAHVECRCFMGVFPEINRAWITIDNRLFLWNYSDGSDFYVFDGLDQIIISAGLVPPRPGVFLDEISWLLVLATPVEVVVLGVCLDDGSAFGELSLFPTQLAMPSDNVNMLQIQGHASGRIFMAGRDGCVYELVYASEDGWFTKRCRKINRTHNPLVHALVPSFLSFSKDDPLVELAVDQQRNILYALSESSSIQVYDLGLDGQQCTRVATYSSAATDMARLQPRHSWSGTLLQLIHLAVVGVAESRFITLTAVSSTGIRLYFTVAQRTLTYGASKYPKVDRKYRPKTLELVHVRLPPPTASAPSINSLASPASPGMAGSGGGGSDVQRSADAHTALYSNGVLLLADARAPDSDTVVAVSRDLTQTFQRSNTISSFAASSGGGLIEAVTHVPLTGKVWSIAEVPMHQAVASGGHDGHEMARNELATQHKLPPRQFLCLTNTGLHTFVKLRPADQLQNALLSLGESGEAELIAFFKQYGPNQACAMCLVLACSRPHALPTYAPYALPMASASAADADAGPGEDAASGAGGHQGIGALSPYHLLTPNPAPDPGIVHAATAAFFRFGGEPHFDVPRAPSMSNQPSMYVMGRALSTPDIVFSGAHNGIYLYFARLVGPIWTQLITTCPLVPRAVGSGTEPDVRRQSLRFTKAQLQEIVQPLLSLRNFFAENRHFLAPLLAVGAGVGLSSSPGGSVQQSQPQPQQQVAVASSPAEEARRAEQQSLNNMHSLLQRCLEGVSLLGVLADHRFDALVAGLPLEMQQRVARLAFRDLVTSFEGLDVARNLVNELMNAYAMENASVEVLSETMRQRCPGFFSANDILRYKGLELMEKAKSSRGAEQLRYLRKSVELYIKVVHNVQLSDVAAQYRTLGYFSGVVELALAQAGTLDTDDDAGRSACYHEILTALDELFFPADEREARDLEHKQQQVLQQAVASSDAAFHVALYRWLIDRSLTEQLLVLKTPHLETFLRNENVELLWQYYVRSQQYSAAVQVLARLANHPSAALTLAQRIEYLSLAVANAKSARGGGSGSGSSGGDTLHQLQEKMDVAEIQLKLMNELQAMPGASREEAASIAAAVRELDSQLFNISDMYNRYAKRFGLWDSMLAILHCSGHQDTGLVRQVWERILQRSVDKAEHGGGVSQALATTVANLGRLYYPNDVIFPVAFLAQALEQISMTRGPDHNPTWVVATLHDVGVPLSTLFDVYRELVLDSKDSLWQRPDAQLHLLTVLAHVIDTWVQHVRGNRASPLERRRFHPSALAEVIKHLIDLAGTLPAAATVTRQLQDLATSVASSTAAAQSY